jgi:hypothetical protein
VAFAASPIIPRGTDTFQEVNDRAAPDLDYHWVVSFSRVARVRGSQSSLSGWVSAKY